MKLLLVALAALSIGACDSPVFNNDDGLTYFEADDSEMNAAIAEARQTMPSFWAAYDSDPDVRANAMIKVGLPTDGDGQEHIWTKEITREGGVVRGRLANEPVYLPGMALGSEVVIEPERISDWSYTRGGKLWGSYTTRVMLRELSKAEADEMRAMLSPTPLEGGQ